MPNPAIWAWLELDEVREERFDGIEDTLYGRLSDPFGYRPVHAFDSIERAKEKSALEAAEETSLAIREAAEKLRTKAKEIFGAAW